MAIKTGLTNAIQNGLKIGYGFSAFCFFLGKQYFRTTIQSFDEVKFQIVCSTFSELKSFSLIIRQISFVSISRCLSLVWFAPAKLSFGAGKPQFDTSIRQFGGSKRKTHQLEVEFNNVILSQNQAQGNYISYVSQRIQKERAYRMVLAR